jgi:hypothetical protein
MAIRDTSRIKVKFFEQTTVPTGTGPTPDPVDANSDVYMCLIDGPNWSGFTRGDVETTCSNTTLDAWGNLIRQYEGGKMVDLGTLTLTVDWDPDDAYGGREWAAFFDGRAGNLLIEFPAKAGETTGPILTVNGYCNSFTPSGTVLSDDDNSRSKAELVWKVNSISVAAPVAAV